MSTRLREYRPLAKCPGPLPGIACADGVWVRVDFRERCNGCVERRRSIRLAAHINTKEAT